jgi:hypothetical protein
LLIKRVLMNVLYRFTYQQFKAMYLTRWYR